MRRRLLILDDDPAVASTVRMMAERIGCEVRTADKAQLFYAQIETWDPTDILIDLVMPLIDGVEVLLELSRRGCRARIVIVSGAGSRVLDAARRAAAEYGLETVGVLPKPFTFGKFRWVLNHGVAGDLAPRQASAPDPSQIAADELRAAIEKREIAVVYQPKLQCQGLRLSGFEALARWTHPSKGPIAPSLFIPMAENCGLIDALTQIVFEDALGWLGASFPRSKMTMAFNFSIHALSDIRLPDSLAATARARGIDPKRVILELTETSAMADPGMTISLATRLRLKGFRLSIGDFGVGYSSLAQLARLPFSELKIDASFVRGIAGNKESSKIVKAIVDLGHSLGLHVVADGVEDKGALDAVTELRCDFAQGDFIAGPMSGDAVAIWLKEAGVASAPPQSQAVTEA